MANEEQECIEINETNWEQFVRQYVEVSNGFDVWQYRILYAFVGAHPTHKFVAGEAAWRYAQIAKPKEKVFKVSPDHREIFEALANGALMRGDSGAVHNDWSSHWDIRRPKILLTPDYTRPLSEQEWIRMEVSE